MSQYELNIQKYIAANKEMLQSLFPEGCSFPVKVRL